MTAGFAGHATEPVGGNAVGGYVPDAPRDVPGAGAACVGRSMPPAGPVAAGDIR
ncbi:hypothetical protein ACIF9R_23805 [Streptomyces sp. NPDC086080]|uniref:hypothetical protein n=1 Tax=Streptomyces sp. NPDC086080 TaxID=3365748 RepID=UPI0037D53149